LEPMNGSRRVRERVCVRATDGLVAREEEPAAHLRHRCRETR
jgi:hypothetical protein